MRKLLVVLASLCSTGVAVAQPVDVIDPYAAPAVEVAAPPLAAQVVDPYATPPPAAPNRGYFYPPPGYAAPIYSYPPPVYYMVPPQNVRVRVRACNGAACNLRDPNVHPRFFSAGVHLSVMGLNQSINGHDVVMGGAGVHLRFRTRGRFGLEGAIDFLHGGFDPGGDATTPTAPMVSNGTDATGTPSSTSTQPYFHVGPVTRDSIPVTLSALVYIFPNDDRRIFNLYFLGGFGLVSTTMGLLDEYGNNVQQKFTEFEGHLGVGAELRFRWLAIQADVRGIGLVRDDSDAGQFYKNADGGPVPKSSSGAQGTLGASIWF